MTIWRPCSVCKKPIHHGQAHWVCSVSTCNRVRSPFVFCSLGCWDAHNPTMNHRSSWAEERRAPSAPPLELPRVGGTQPSASASTGRQATASSGSEPDGRRRIVRGESAESEPRDVLIVASKLKAYIKERADMNTAGDVLEPLSDLVREAADRAIENAREDGRRTVKGRDFR